ncbi:HAD-IIB family hydrolase [Deinococcus sp.]|uniref:HAD-IIB family hydrolase n=1 Tax=Deinococcus sp. TaxID=47478 RepID=UPI003CC5D008
MSALLLAFDLDGTLLPDGGQRVPPATRAALRRLHALNIPVAIITGRDMPPDDVLDAAQPTAVATNNGGRILLGGTLHRETRFDPADLKAVLAHELDDARVMAFTADKVYVDIPPNTPVPQWLAYRPHAPLSEAPAQGVLKVGFYHPDIRGWRDALAESHPHLVMTGAQPPYTDFLTITPAGADKGAALLAIAQGLGIELADTMVFGDSDNDLAMLELAGVAVQVGHLPLLRPYAHEVLDGPETLGAYLEALAERLERDALSFQKVVF